MNKWMKYDRRIAIGISVIVAVLIFLFIYGPYSLDVTNDAWIIKGYDGTDIIQHYAGWTQYRISNWDYPLGYANTLAYRDGTYITYTDSIPYVAILCKVFRNILPDTFQYFGWFTLICFVLQGIGTCLLIQRTSKSYCNIIFAEILFITAPIFIERAFKHTALGAQWFVLFSLYYYLEYRDKKDMKKLPWQMILLATLTIGIHPYFLPMVMIFVLLIVIEAVIRRHDWKRIIGYVGCVFGSPIAMGLVIGVIGTGVENTRGGYGIFGMNLNSLINPRSYGGFQWSKVLPQRAQILHNYDGFNYLGLGVLLMLLWCTGLFLIRLLREKSYIHQVRETLRRNIPFILCMAFMTIFAVSSTVAWDEKVLFEIPLPQFIRSLCDIFRASGRMFYPVYYTIYVMLISYLLASHKKIIGTLVLCGFVSIQMIDMSAVFEAKHECMKTGYYAETIFDDEVLIEVPEKEVLVVLGEMDFDLKRVLAIYAAKHNMAVSYSVANTGKYPNSYSLVYDVETEINSGTMNPNVMYVTQDESMVQNWRVLLQGQEYQEYRRGYYYFVYME